MPTPWREPAPPPKVRGMTLETTIIPTRTAEFAACHGGPADAPALVFLHAGVADQRVWQGVMETLSDAFRVIAYDRRGFGDTRADPSIFAHPEDLKTVLDHFGVTRAVLVGNSQGGRIAVDVTLEAPERVAGLVLIAPAVTGAKRPRTFPPAVDRILKALEAAEDADDLKRVNALEAHLWLDGPEADEGRVSGAPRDLFLAMNNRILRANDVGSEEKRASAMDRLSEIACPVHLMWGDLDLPGVRDFCTRLADDLPNAGTQILTGMAHLPMLEAPDAVSGAIRSFLTGRIS